MAISFRGRMSRTTDKSQKYINIIAGVALSILLLIVAMIIILSFQLGKRSDTEDGLSNYSGIEARVAEAALNFGRGNIGSAFLSPHIHIAKVEKTTAGKCNTEVSTGEPGNRYRVEVEEVGDSGFVLTTYSTYVYTY